MSPTMMYLYTNGKYKDYEVYGLYDLKIKDNDSYYYENLNSYKNEIGGCKQQIEPSIYYDENLNLKLQADGIKINIDDSIKLNLTKNYPQEVKYLDKNVIISDFRYLEDKAVIEVKIKRDEVQNILTNPTLDNTMLNSNTSRQENDYWIEEYYFDIDEKEEYEFKLNLIVNHEYPIETDIYK